MTGARAALVALLFLGVVGGVPACGGEAPPRAIAPRAPAAPQWQDVFDTTPDLYAVVRPQAFKRDAVYGAFFKSLLRVAQARGAGAALGATALEAAEGCEEIIIGARRDSGGDDAAIVLRGVDASIDPRSVRGTDGQRSFRVVDDGARVLELERIDRAGGAGGLFVLPDRTWVIAIGAARARARQAFAAPAFRPIPKTEADALASIRLDAASLLQRGRVRHEHLAPLTKKLASVTLDLPSGSGIVRLILQYADDDASAWAELHAKRIAAEIAEADAARFGWLKDARLRREGHRILVEISLPQRLLDTLPNVTGADLPF